MTTSFNSIANSKAGKAALQSGANYEINRDAIAPVLRGYINAGFTREHAPQVLTCVRAIVATKRKADGVTKPLPPVQDSRKSELASVLALGEWACRNALFDTLEKANASLDTIVSVSKKVRKLVDKKTGACSAKQVFAWINARKDERNSKGKNKRVRVVNPVVAIDAIAKHARALTMGWGKADGAAFVTAIMKACTSYKPIAVKNKAAADKARDAAKAAKKASK